MTDPNRPEPAPETQHSTEDAPVVPSLRAPVLADTELRPQDAAEPAALFIGPLPLPEPEPMTLPEKAVCIWCGHKVRYTSDAQAREHFAYCSADCKAEMDNVFDDDIDRAFNVSQRLKKIVPRSAPPWAVKKPSASGSQKLDAVSP